MRLSYAIARLFQIIPTFIMIGIVVFLLARAMPGDTISLMNDRATDEAIAEMQRQVGLDKPLWEQFIAFFNGLLHGNLGTSINYDALGTEGSAVIFETLAVDVEPEYLETWIDFFVVANP